MLVLIINAPPASARVKLKKLILNQIRIRIRRRKYSISISLGHQTNQAAATRDKTGTLSTFKSRDSTFVRNMIVTASELCLSSVVSVSQRSKATQKRAKTSSSSFSNPSNPSLSKFDVYECANARNNKEIERSKRNELSTAKSAIVDNSRDLATAAQKFDPFEQRSKRSLESFSSLNGVRNGRHQKSLWEEMVELDEEFARATERMFNNNNTNNTNNMNETNETKTKTAKDEYGPNRTYAKEYRKETRGENSYSNVRYSESVTTYGNSSIIAQNHGNSGYGRNRGSGRSNSLVDIPTMTCFALFALAFTYFKEKRIFEKHFDRTTFKRDERTRLANRWPLLYISNEKFRDEFNKTKRFELIGAEEEEEEEEKEEKEEKEEEEEEEEERRRKKERRRRTY